MTKSAEAVQPIQTLWGQFYLIANRLLYWDTFLQSQLATLDPSEPLSPGIRNQMERIRENSELLDSRLTPFLGSPSRQNTVLGIAAIGPREVVGIDGYAITAFQDGEVIKFRHCENLDCSASTLNAVININNTDPARVSLAVGSDGFPILVVTGTNSTNFTGIHCGSIDCSSGGTIIPERYGYAPDIAIGEDGLPLISFLIGDNITGGSVEPFDVIVLHCGDVSCTADGTARKVGTAYQIITAFFVPELYTSIEKGSDGHPLVAIYSFTSSGNATFNGSELDILRCGDINCADPNGDTLHKVADGDAFLPSIAIDEDGLPVITYDNNSKAVKCGTVTC